MPYVKCRVTYAHVKAAAPPPQEYDRDPSDHNGLWQQHFILVLQMVEI